MEMYPETPGTAALPTAGGTRMLRARTTYSESGAVMPEALISTNILS